jgi:hypothetical protein
MDYRRNPWIISEIQKKLKRSESLRTTIDELRVKESEEDELSVF